MMKKEYDIIIAIDPDVTKSGVAFLIQADKKIECDSLTFSELVDYLQYIKRENELNSPKLKVIIVVEAGWLNYSNWHVKKGDNKKMIAYKGNAVGRNHETGRKIVEIAEHYGFEVYKQKPLRKIWSGDNGKITSEELAEITGYNQRTNQDQRDAILIAWNFAELPMIIKSNNNNFKKAKNETKKQH